MCVYIYIYICIYIYIYIYIYTHMAHACLLHSIVLSALRINM